ncbi:hypothetical protein COB57_04875 [Candidatus Peregrinibacteria bacterium]|nr:MAG: hypothetical protein COB57_04875 [Candidatus Peregrinibacteria bacterium]
MNTEKTFLWIKKLVRGGMWGVIVICVLFLFIGFNLSCACGGSPGRARDTARKGDLTSFQGALDVYLNDNGAYPISTGECMDPATSTVADASYVLKGYMRGGKIPADPLDTANEGLCRGREVGRYWYRSVSVEGKEGGGYIICSDAEEYQNANAKGAMIIKGIKSVEDEAFTTALNIDLTEPTEDPGDSLYCVRN